MYALEMHTNICYNGVIITKKEKCMIRNLELFVERMIGDGVLDVP